MEKESKYLRIEILKRLMCDLLDAHYTTIILSIFHVSLTHLNICLSCTSFYQHFSNNTNHGSNDNKNNNSNDIKQQQQPVPPPPPSHLYRHHNTKQCAKCGDIHSAFNGNGNYCKSGQPFELVYLCIKSYVCIVCVVLLSHVEALNSVAIRASHDRFGETFVASV